MKMNKTKGKQKAFILLVSIALIAGLLIAILRSAVLLEREPIVKGNTDPISYNGEVYTYNHDLINFLCMGVDSYDNLDKEAEQSERGQADAIFIVSLNKKNGDIKIVSIPRDVMVPIEVYNKNGEKVATQSLQITVQYAYGLNEEDSCKRMSEKVSELLHNIPIQRYCAANFNAVPVLNDAIGGVTVTMNPDYVDAELLAIDDVAFAPGNTVHLIGEMSLIYLHTRDITVYASAADRMERQKTYIKAYINTAKDKIASDPKILFELYKALNKSITTNVSLPEMLSLTTYLKNMEFNSENVYSLEGTRVKGEKHEEVYTSDEQVMKLLTDVFYEKVE